MTLPDFCHIRKGLYWIDDIYSVSKLRALIEPRPGQHVDNNHRVQI